MLKDARSLRLPDSYYSGEAGFVGSTIEQLHADMRGLELPESVPDGVRHVHTSIRHAYIYSYFAYDLLRLAAAETVPCLELALRLRVGKGLEGRLTKKGKPRPPATLPELLEEAHRLKLISADTSWINPMRRMFAHGNDAVLNPPMFLSPFEAVTAIIAEVFDCNIRAGFALVES
jgi:hypothetical protein